ncbi:hypothetical protein [Dysgonomonas massiliensis]|uniref:hypothetical protein n=1 Tax=Dysgonomonas massiliensis TaxID=2040292 RepID=UPI000C75D9DF|nr:hypothetical protein [Dysgonomonas massiliensis]
MNKNLLYLFSGIISATFLLFTSCKGCVKDTSKKITEVTMSAAEGVAEAIDENGASLAEKTANAANSIALGLGRSLDKQLDQHAEKVASIGGRTLVQTVDGLLNGLDSELKEHYSTISYSENLVEGIKLDYIAKYKNASSFDAYFIINQEGTYTCTFEFCDTDNNVFLKKEGIATKTEDNDYKYTLISFALTKEEIQNYEKNFKEIKVSATKQ